MRTPSSLKQGASYFDGSDPIDTQLQSWVAMHVQRDPRIQPDLLHNAIELLQSQNVDVTQLATGMELTDLVLELKMDTATACAAMLYRAVRNSTLSIESVRERMGHEIADLVASVLQMATTSLLELSNAPMQTKEARDQVANVRRMLVMLIDDARVAVLKLSERVVALRHAKLGADTRKRRIAKEAQLVFAPLASRLGIWRVKWELEDLALRYLEPQVYADLATALDGRRIERERAILSIAEQVKQELVERMRQDGVAVTVNGRAKNIYSILRKMRSKGVPFSQVYDVNAIRVLVPTVADCYTTLGVIHTRWQHIPTEFDDYITKPKGNGYRSIHTAVTDSAGKTLEVQIRTHEMHEEAEFGVCAHWHYKSSTSTEDEGTPSVATGNGDSFYDEKMKWLRQVIEWQEEMGVSFDLSAELSEQVSTERIFVYTPAGHVLDMVVGATPLDFAYRVHTEVGHRCIRATVDGIAHPLNKALQTGQQVEIHTSATAQPRWEWLDQRLGFATTARAREKLRLKFREQGLMQNQLAGRRHLDQALARLGFAPLNEADSQKFATAMRFEKENQAFAAIAQGELAIGDAIAHLAAEYEGHQQSLLDEDMPSVGSYSLVIRSDNRNKMLNDVLDVLSSQNVSLNSTVAEVEPATNRAIIRLGVVTSSLAVLSTLVELIRHLNGVEDVYRTLN